MKITVEFDSFEEFMAFKNGKDKHPVSNSDLTIRTKNCLIGAGIATIEDAKAITDHDLLMIPNFGRKSINEIREYCRMHGL